MANETDTATRVREILDDLNNCGAGAWDEFVYTLPEYSRAKTSAVYQGPGGAFEDARWIMQDFGGDETWMP